MTEHDLNVEFQKKRDATAKLNKELRDRFFPKLPKTRKELDAAYDMVIAMEELDAAWYWAEKAKIKAERVKALGHEETIKRGKEVIAAYKED